MGWSDAIAAVFGTAKKVLDRLWGTQTREMDTLEAQADHAATEKQAALDGGDLRAVNFWDGELKRLHREIAAKRG
jgi:hypothetical protein